MINLTPAAVKAVQRFIRGSETPVAGLRLVISGGIRVSESELAAQKSPNRARLSERPEGFTAPSSTQRP